MAEGKIPSPEETPKLENVGDVRETMRRLEEGFDNPVINLKKLQEMDEMLGMMQGFFEQIDVAVEIQQTLDNFEQAIDKEDAKVVELLKQKDSRGHAGDPEAGKFIEAYYLEQARIDRIRAEYFELMALVKRLLYTSERELKETTSGEDLRKQILNQILKIKKWVYNLNYQEGFDAFAEDFRV